MSVPPNEPPTESSDEAVRRADNAIKQLQRRIESLRFTLDQIASSNKLGIVAKDNLRDLEKLEKQIKSIETSLKRLQDEKLISPDQFNQLQSALNNVKQELNGIYNPLNRLVNVINTASTAAGQASNVYTGFFQVFQSGLDVVYNYANQQLALYNATINQISATNQLAQANALYSLTISRFGQNSTQAVAASQALRYAQLNQISAVQSVNQQYLQLQYAPAIAFTNMAQGFAQITDSVYGLLSVVLELVGGLTSLLHLGTSVGGSLGNIFSSLGGGGGGGVSGGAGTGGLLGSVLGFVSSGGGAGGGGGGLNIGSILGSILGLAGGTILESVLNQYSQGFLSKISSRVSGGLSQFLQPIANVLNTIGVPALPTTRQYGNLTLPGAQETLQQVGTQEQQLLGAPLPVLGIGDIITKGFLPAAAQALPTILALTLPFLLSQLLSGLFSGRGGGGGGGGSLPPPIGGGGGGGYGGYGGCIEPCGPVPITTPMPLPIDLPIPVPIKTPSPIDVNIPDPLPITTPEPLPMDIQDPAPLANDIADELNPQLIAINQDLQNVPSELTAIDSDIQRQLPELEQLNEQMAQQVMYSNGMMQILRTPTGVPNIPPGGLSETGLPNFGPLINASDQATQDLNVLGVSSATAGQGLENLVTATNKVENTITNTVNVVTVANNGLEAAGEAGNEMSKLFGSFNGNLEAFNMAVEGLPHEFIDTGGALTDVTNTLNDIKDASDGVPGAFGDLTDAADSASGVLGTIAKIAGPVGAAISVGLAGYNIYQGLKSPAPASLGSTLSQLMSPQPQTGGFWNKVSNFVSSLLATIVGGSTQPSIFGLNPAQQIINAALQGQTTAITPPPATSGRGGSGYAGLGQLPLQQYNPQQITYAAQQILQAFQQGQIGASQFDIAMQSLIDTTKQYGDTNAQQIVPALQAFQNEIDKGNQSLQNLEAAFLQTYQNGKLSSQQLEELSNSLVTLSQGGSLTTQQLNDLTSSLSILQSEGFLSSSAVTQLVSSFRQMNQVNQTTSAVAAFNQGLQLTNGQVNTLQSYLNQLYKTGQINQQQFAQLSAEVQALAVGSMSSLNQGLVDLNTNQKLTAQQGQQLIAYFTALSNAGAITANQLQKIIADIDQLSGLGSPTPPPPAPPPSGTPGSPGGHLGGRAPYPYYQSGGVIVGEAGPELLLGTQATKALLSSQDNLIAQVIRGMEPQPVRGFSPLPITPFPISQPQQPITVPPINMTINVSSNVDLITLRREIENVLAKYFSSAYRRGVY